MKFQFNLSHTRFSKLKSFLTVWLLRLQSRQFIDSSELDTAYLNNYTDKLAGAVKLIEEHLTFPLPDAEIEYLYLFLITDDYLELDDTFKEEFPHEYQMSNDLIQRVYESQTTAGYAHINKQALLGNLTRVNIAISYFYVEPSTFIDQPQIDIFEKDNPLFSRVVHEYIDSLRTDDVTISKKFETNLYLSYIFVLINLIPMKIMVTPIYIYVDFSLGKLYTKYIVEQLNNNFRNTNIQVQETMDENTNIYLSDLPSELIQIPQILWGTPPAPADWGNLVEEITKIKAIKDEKYRNA